MYACARFGLSYALQRCGSGVWVAGGAHRRCVAPRGGLPRVAQNAAKAVRVAARLGDMPLLRMREGRAHVDGRVGRALVQARVHALEVVLGSAATV